MWEQEDRLCSVLAAASVHLPPSAMPPRPVPASSASTWQQKETWTRRETEPDVHTIARYMPRRQSGAFHSRTETPWREFLMENGDRQKVLQHRLLGIYPDYLDFQRIVAWSSGSHIPPAIHVSKWEHWFKTLWGCDGRQLWVCPLSSGVKRYFSHPFIFCCYIIWQCWRLHQCKRWVFKAQCSVRHSPQAQIYESYSDHLWDISYLIFYV